MDYVRLLFDLSPAIEDRESLEQVQGLLQPLQMELTSAVAGLPKRLVNRST